MVSLSGISASQGTFTLKSHKSLRMFIYVLLLYFMYSVL